MVDRLQRTRLDTVQAHVDAENVQDLDAIMATWSTTETVVLSYNRIAVEGLDAVRRSYKARVTQLPNFGFDLVRRHEHGDMVIAEQVLRFDGTDGERIESASVVFYEFDRVGLLREERVYLNELPLAPYFYPHLWREAVGNDPSRRERALRNRDEGNQG